MILSLWGMFSLYLAAQFGSEFVKLLLAEFRNVIPGSHVTISQWGRSSLRDKNASNYRVLHFKSCQMIFTVAYLVSKISPTNRGNSPNLSCRTCGPNVSQPFLSGNVRCNNFTWPSSSLIALEISATKLSRSQRSKLIGNYHAYGQLYFAYLFTHFPKHLPDDLRFWLDKHLDVRLCKSQSRVRILIPADYISTQVLLYVLPEKKNVYLWRDDQMQQKIIQIE